MPSARVLAVALALAVPLRIPAGEPVQLQYDLTVDVSVTAAAGALWIGSELLKDELAPSTCRWCAVNPFDAWAREHLVASWSHEAKRTSDVLAFAVLPAAVATNAFLSARSAGDAQEGWVDLLLVAEAATLAANLNQLVKYTVGRQRPFVHYGNYDDPDRAPDSDDNLSFYSGHTTLAFSLAAAAGTVSSMRGYKSTPWVWGVGMTTAAAVGYLRIAGDKHYLTDVLVGAAAGTAIGILVPRVFHGPKDEEGGPATSIAPTLGGFVVVF